VLKSDLRRVVTPSAVVVVMTVVATVTAVLCDLWIDQLPAMRLEAFERLFLIRLISRE
jgi:hypothetical protein